MNKDAKKLKKLLDAKHKRNDDKSFKPLDLEASSAPKLTDYVTKEETLSEYFSFLRNLPIMPEFEQKKWISLVEEEWGIGDILKTNLKPVNLIALKNGHDLTDKLSAKLGQSLRIITPPVKNCLFLS